MLSENQRIRGLISSVIDIVLLIAAYLLANFLRFNWLPFFEEGGAGPALDIARSPMVALGWAGYAVVMVLLPRGHAAAVRVQHRLFDLQADDQALV